RSPMRRRDLSKFLGTFAAGVSLAPPHSQALETSSERYPRIAAEIGANVVPNSFDYAPGDIRRYGASSSAPHASNRAALQTAISPVGHGGEATIVVPSGISYGYKATDPTTHPDFEGTDQPVVVQDYGPGESYSGFPAAYDGAQVRLFFFTPETSGTLRLGGALRPGATTATLSAPWPHLSGPWKVTFSNSDVRLVNLTQGTVTASWRGGLSAAAGATAKYVDPNHDGNAL